MAISKNQPKSSQPLPAPSYDFFAGLLSYLIPGLGQIFQGRVAKGIVFFVCIHGLFGYGMALGEGLNVYIPRPENLPKVTLPVLGDQEGIVKALYYRPQYCAQFWTGVAAWPAIWQFKRFDPQKDADSVLGTIERCPSEDVINKKQADGDRTWDLAWVFTVIAGVLNIMVIYDAAAGPAFRLGDEENPRATPAPFGNA